MTRPSDDLTTLSIYGISRAEYQALRVKAAQHGMTISRYCYQLLKERTSNFTNLDLKEKKNDNI